MPVLRYPGLSARMTSEARSSATSSGGSDLSSRMAATLGARANASSSAVLQGASAAVLASRQGGSRVLVVGLPVAVTIALALRELLRRHRS